MVVNFKGTSFSHRSRVTTQVVNKGVWPIEVNRSDDINTPMTKNITFR